MHQISDGQRRRVQIFLGLIRPFKILLMDEVRIMTFTCVCLYMCMDKLYVYTCSYIYSSTVCIILYNLYYIIVYCITKYLLILYILYNVYVYMYTFRWQFH